MKKILLVIVGVAILCGVLIAARGSSKAIPNLIANPSLEVAHGARPLGWHPASWGSNTSNFTYDTGGAADGNRAVTATITAFKSGAAEWVPTAIPVTAGPYHFQDSYRSSVPTEVGGTVIYADKHSDYLYIGTLPASTGWQPVDLTVNVPVNAVSISVFQAVYKVGFVQSDNYSLMTGAAPVVKGSTTTTTPRASSSTPPTT